MRVFVGMETSGEMRRAFQRHGHQVFSCDLLPAEDSPPPGDHWIGDVFDTLDWLRIGLGWHPDLAIFHPTCTYLTSSAEWAYADGPLHQRVKPETLVGAARREARTVALAQFRCLLSLPIERIAVENPVGVVSTAIRKPDQIVHPWWFGDNASKATCLWLKNLPLLVKTDEVAPRIVNGRPRWGNQTGTGQNKLTPTPDRWKDRARTYPGFAAACAARWGQPEGPA
jgi:hypothetical protein